MSTINNGFNANPDGRELRPKAESRVRHKDRPGICSSMGDGEILTVKQFDPNFGKTYGGFYFLENGRGQVIKVPQTMMCEGEYDILPPQDTDGNEDPPSLKDILPGEAAAAPGQTVERGAQHRQSSRDQLQMMLAA